MRKRDEFFTDDGELVPGFTGIGSFVGKRAEEFSREEQIVLSHFYTNVDSNVYCAKDNMSSELWALVMGQFARSHLSAKERTIQLFRDVHKKDPDNVPPLEYIADVPILSTPKLVISALATCLSWILFEKNIS